MVRRLRKASFLLLLLCLLITVAGCGTSTESALRQTGGAKESVKVNQDNALYTRDTKIEAVKKDPVFREYGRLIFPADEGYYSGSTLGTLSLTWYSNMDPEKTVEIANYMKTHAAAGDTIFYDIYSETEKAEDPEKADTGLFFF